MVFKLTLWNKCITKSNRATTSKAYYFYWKELRQEGNNSEFCPKNVVFFCSPSVKHNTMMMLCWANKARGKHFAMYSNTNSGGGGRQTKSSEKRIFEILKAQNLKTNKRLNIKTNFFPPLDHHSPFYKIYRKFLALFLKASQKKKKVESQWTSFKE